MNQNFLAKSFDETLRYFNISGKAIALRASTSPSAISEFRNGKRNVSSTQLEHILLAMDELEPGSRRYFCILLAGENPTALAEQVEFLKPAELAALLNLIADRLAAKPSREMVGTLS